MSYGKIKANALIYDQSGSDTEVNMSELVTKLGASDLGVSVQPYDANTALTDTAQTFTADQTFNNLTVDGAYKQVAESVSALNLNLTTGNYFTKTISADSTFTFSNPPSSGTVASFTLEITHTSGSITWPSSVKWPSDVAPYLATGKTHLFIFITDDGGSRYRGAAIANYTN